MIELLGKYWLNYSVDTDKKDFVRTVLFIKLA